MDTLSAYFKNIQERNGAVGYIQSCSELIDCVQQVGFLPLLDCGIVGYCAEAMMAPDYHYVLYEDGSWEWPLWMWKGPVITDGNCVYGKFFAGKAGFISREWWPDFYNWRRSVYPQPEIGSTEDSILTILRELGSAVARDLRASCGMVGPKMRGRFDAYINRLQMGCYIVTEDFVYPHDKHGHTYGFGWQLLNTPERLLGDEACLCNRTPEESYQRMVKHLTKLLPGASEKQIKKILK